MQMSLWGATVITNLFSAIPWIGTNLVESPYIISLLPILGKIGGENLKLNKSYSSIPYSFLAFFIGLIDGDGNILITRTPENFISIKLIITLPYNDISTLMYIKSVLKLGEVYVDLDMERPTCILILDKMDLQYILFPLFIKHELFF
jgi:hypothetical protein